MVRPEWMSVPVPRSEPAPGRTGRRKFIDISAVVYGVARGNVVCTVHPRGPSASRHNAEPETTPCGASSQSVTGMLKTALPYTARSNVSPVK